MGQQKVLFARLEHVAQHACKQLVHASRLRWRHHLVKGTAWVC